MISCIWLIFCFAYVSMVHCILDLKLRLILLSLLFAQQRVAQNADQQFKCDFDDLFNLLTQFIAKEVRYILGWNLYAHNSHFKSHMFWERWNMENLRPSCDNVIQNSMLIVPFWKASGSYFGFNTKQEIVFFSERSAKAGGAKVSVWHQSITFKTFTKNIFTKNTTRIKTPKLEAFFFYPCNFIDNRVKVNIVIYLVLEAL